MAGACGYGRMLVCNYCVSFERNRLYRVVCICMFVRCAMIQWRIPPNIAGQNYCGTSLTRITPTQTYIATDKRIAYTYILIKYG